MKIAVRASTVDQHQPNAQVIEQGEIVHQIRKLGVGQHLPAEGDHKGAATKGTDIGRGLAKPVDKGRLRLRISH